MMLWVEPFMWAMCRVLAYALQLIGLGGLLVFAAHGLMRIIDWLSEV